MTPSALTSKTSCTLLLAETSKFVYQFTKSFRLWGTSSPILVASRSSNSKYSLLPTPLLQVDEAVEIAQFTTTPSTLTATPSSGQVMCLLRSWDHSPGFVRRKTTIFKLCSTIESLTPEILSSAQALQDSYWGRREKLCRSSGQAWWWRSAVYLVLKPT